MILSFYLPDYITIRKTHRIAGNLIGSTAGYPHDPSIKGLPAVYNPYETQILIDEGLVDVVSSTGSHSEEMRDTYKAYIDRQMEEQAARWTNKDREMCGKDLLYHIPTGSPYNDKTAIAANSLPAPNPRSYKIYRDLWNRGFFITNGHSFGGDFLIYPHDPIICHATHVVHVLEKPTLSAKDFITVNRLCVGVKKECLFAYADPEDPEQIQYQTSAWDSTWKD